MYSQDSIDLLQNSGLQFKKHEEEGIDTLYFAELLMTSGPCALWKMSSGSSSQVTNSSLFYHCWVKDLTFIFRADLLNMEFIYIMTLIHLFCGCFNFKNVILGLGLS